MITGDNYLDARRLPTVFDTGSAGLVLNALAVFPSSMVSASGFVFPAGQSSLSYNGITVTNVQGTRSYGGGSDERTLIGNIGFAQVTFGGMGPLLKTASMPVLFFYTTVKTGTTTTTSAESEQGIFGVNAAAASVTVPNSTVPASGSTECSPDSKITCLVVSVFKYLSYAPGVNAGFLLEAAALQECDISSVGSCLSQQVLTVGLNNSLESGFSTESLQCPQSGYDGPATIEGYSVCQPTIPGTTVSVMGTSPGTLSTAVLFDTGQPEMEIDVPSGTSFPSTVPAESVVTVETPSGYTYNYTAATSPETVTPVVQDSSRYSSVGIYFFTAHAFFSDFSSNIVGWH